MQLVLATDATLSKLYLPEKISGQHWVVQTNADGTKSRVVSVEGINGDWILKSSKTASLLDAEGLPVREMALEPNRFYSVRVDSVEEPLIIRSEPSTEDRKRFRKFVLPSQGALSIGRVETADIRFASRFVSKEHAELLIGESGTTLHDKGSSNGTFVNSKRVESAVLSPGDVVTILAMTMVFGDGFVAINDPDGLVTLNQEVLKPLAEQPVEPRSDDEIEESQPGVSFSRSPRFKQDIVTAKIKIDSPPALDTTGDMPIMMTLGPALTMGMASMFMGIFALTQAMAPGGNIMTAMPTLVMSLAMMTGMILWPILSRRYEKRMRIKKEAIRQKKYRDYLAKMRVTIDDERERQSEILRSSIVTVEDCVSRIRSRERSLWERMISHNDFLKVRLGLGDWPFDANIRYAERSFSVDDDDLLDEMYSIAEEPSLLGDVPVSLSLYSQPLVGLIGPYLETRELLTGIIVQLAALHGYDELKMVFILGEQDEDVWEYARILPHCWSDDKRVRYIATTQSEVKELNALLAREFEKRESLSTDEDRAEITPHYVVFCLDKELAAKAAAVENILTQKNNLGFSLFFLYDRLSDLPRECRVVVEVSENLSRVYYKDDTSGFLVFEPDIALKDDVLELVEYLSNTRLETIEDAFTLPEALTFLEMYGVGKVEHLNALTRWSESNPVLSLEAPIGVDTSGTEFKLDLHERFHGPHGLIAGMTGSGKSELIMTYILSLAVSFHPDEVAFVLIDYKGGGMANSFASLPHLAGTITNLDGAAVNRALVSLQSELKRRQAIFNEASERTGTSNIDIYKYQSLYREGAVSEPLPHLLVISDEFAELKTQQPDFMTQLVSAARIGRSLGVHLILATQKPSGVVDDQIWSNSRFRICLKVQEKADSMEVIKRADAAELTATGRFFVQVGFNELFELGQSAWAGAPYYPADRVERAYDDSVVLIDNLGRPLKQAKYDRHRSMFRNPPKQLDEVTRYLTKLAEEEGIQTRPLWLDPIPELIYLDDLKAKYRIGRTDKHNLKPLVGEYDDPASQRQAALCVPITDEGNVVIYGSAGSGKTTLLTTMLFSLIDSYSPAELNLYVLDFASETLRAFKRAPHVGDVLFSHESEKVQNLFKMLGAEMEHRKGLFADYGGDFESYVSESGVELPTVVVAIHNHAAFIETYEDLESTVAFLCREGTKYGIYFVLTASSVSAVRYRVLQSFKQLLVLRQNDPTEYAGILGNTDGVLPSQFEGRGIFRSGCVYEFQTAHLSRGVDNELAFIRDYCEAASEKWKGATARHVPVLPRKVDLDYLADEIRQAPSGHVPIGVNRDSLEIVYYDFRKPLVTLVLSRANDDGTFLEGLADALAIRYDNRAVVLDPKHAFGPAAERTYGYVSETQPLNEAVLELFDEMVSRNNAVVHSRESAEPTPTFDERIYLVTSLGDLLACLSEDHREKFAAMLLKCDASLRVNFIFADDATRIGTIMYEPWAKARISTVDGIWIGDGFTDQFTLQANSTTPQMYEQIGPSFGYSLSKGRPILIKMLSSTGGGD